MKDTLEFALVRVICIKETWIDWKGGINRGNKWKILVMIV